MQYYSITVAARRGKNGQKRGFWSILTRFDPPVYHRYCIILHNAIGRWCRILRWSHISIQAIKLCKKGDLAMIFRFLQYFPYFSYINLDPLVKGSNDLQMRKYFNCALFRSFLRRKKMSSLKLEKSGIMVHPNVHHCILGTQIYHQYTVPLLEDEAWCGIWCTILTLWVNEVCSMVWSGVFW